MQQKAIKIGIVTVAAIALLVGTSHAFESVWAMATLPAEQRPDYCAARLSRLIKPGSRIWGHDCWWLLPPNVLVYDMNHLDVSSTLPVDYLIFSGNQSLVAGKPDFTPEDEAWVNQHFRLIDNNLRKSSLRLFGRQIPRTALGHGVVVYERRPR